MFSAIPVLALPAHPHVRELVHAGAVVAHVPVDLDVELGVEPARNGVRAARVDDPPRPWAFAGERDVMEALIELAERRDGEVDDLGFDERFAHATAALSQT